MKLCDPKLHEQVSLADVYAQRPNLLSPNSDGDLFFNLLDLGDSRYHADLGGADPGHGGLHVARAGLKASGITCK